MPDPQPSVDATRALLAKKLLTAIEVTEKLATQTGTTPEKGSGGMPPKARWYQLMGYLTQTLSGLLQDENLNETKHKVAELMRRVAELSESTQKG